MSSSYGGSAALVVNKQESDRERRLRLRREEYGKRSSAPLEPPGRGDADNISSRAREAYSRGLSRGDDGGKVDYDRGSVSARDRDGAEVHYHELQQHSGVAGGGGGSETPVSRESILEAKKRRYLELYTLFLCPAFTLSLTQALWI